MFISAKFNSICNETGRSIKKGEMIYWIRSTKKVYCKDSNTYKQAIECGLFLGIGIDQFDREFRLFNPLLYFV